MAATNGVNDQVLRWQRELRGYRLRFPEARKPGAQRATEKALGWASAHECPPSAIRSVGSTTRTLASPLLRMSGFGTKATAALRSCFLLMATTSTGEGQRASRGRGLDGAGLRCHDRPMLRAAVLLASVALVMALPAAASNAATAKSLTIRVFVKRVTQSIKDVPPRTFRLAHEYTKGDTIRGTDGLRNAVRQFNKPNGASVGTDRYVFTAVAWQKVRVDFVARFPEARCMPTARARSDRSPSCRSSGARASTREQLVLSRVDTSLTARS
jgi:hypothetical protein